ncbi:MAG: helix-turn-helix transcriptional regulator [Bryobacteraceae bacterium]
MILWGEQKNHPRKDQMATGDDLRSLLTEHDIARITGLSVATVRRWRLRKQGPEFLKIGAAVRYKPSSVMAYLDSRPTGGGDQPERAV